MVTITGAAPGPDRTIHLETTAGHKTIDVAHLLVGPVFENIRHNKDAFDALYLDPRLGTVCWPEELDLAPEALLALPDVRA